MCKSNPYRTNFKQVWRHQNRRSKTKPHVRFQQRYESDTDASEADNSSDDYELSEARKYGGSSHASSTNSRSKHNRMPSADKYYETPYEDFRREESEHGFGRGRRGSGRGRGTRGRGKGKQELSDTQGRKDKLHFQENSGIFVQLSALHYHFVNILKS